MNDITQRIVDHNDSGFNYLKLLEELAELTEVLIKRVNKQPQYKPPIEKITEEMGDVLIRMKILARMEGIEEAVNARKLEKQLKLEGYLANGQFYKNV